MSSLAAQPRQFRPLPNTTLPMRGFDQTPLGQQAIKQRKGVQAGVANRAAQGGSYYGDPTGTDRTNVPTISARQQEANATFRQTPAGSAGNTMRVQPGSPLHAALMDHARFQTTLNSPLPPAPLNSPGSSGGLAAALRRPPGLVSAPLATGGGPSPLTAAMERGRFGPTDAVRANSVGFRSVPVDGPGGEMHAVGSGSLIPPNGLNFAEVGPNAAPLPLDPHVRGVAMSPNLRSRIPSWAGGGANPYGVRGVVGGQPPPLLAAMRNPGLSMDAPAEGSQPALSPGALALANWNEAQAAKAMTAGDQAAVAWHTAEAHNIRQGYVGDASQRLQEHDMNAARVRETDTISKSTPRQRAALSLAGSGVDPVAATAFLDQHFPESGPGDLAARVPDMTPAGLPTPVAKVRAAAFLGARGIDPTLGADGSPITGVGALADRLRQLQLDPMSPEGRNAAMGIRANPALFAAYQRSLRDLAPNPMARASESGFLERPSSQEAANRHVAARVGQPGWMKTLDSLAGGYFLNSPEKLLEQYRGDTSLIQKLLDGTSPR